MNVLVIANEKSGSAGGGILEKVVAEWESRGDVSVIQPPTVESFAEDVRRAAQDKEIVIAAGGDGTLHATVNALWEKRGELLFAVIPMGTGNDFAHTLELPEDPVEAAQRVAEAEATTIDVGRATNGDKVRLFINACMGGFSVAADKAIGESVKKRLGPLAFWVGGAKASVPLTRYEVSIDGRTWDNVAAVGVGNGRTAGGGIPVFTEASPSDGELNCCIIEIDAVTDAVRTVTNLRQGDHVSLPNVDYFAANRIEVQASPEMEFNVDGELINFTTPASFEIAGDIQFLIPK